MDRAVPAPFATTVDSCPDSPMPAGSSPAIDAPGHDTLLIVDDEPQIRRVVRNALGSAFARVVEAADAAAAIDRAAAEQPAFVVLDLGLPDAPGIAVCRELRKWLTAPILVLSARHADAEKVALLDAGADDYMTKPFSAEELRARVRAHRRRAAASLAPPAPIEIDGLRLDLEGRVARRDGAPVHLTPTEWDVLRALAGHAGRTLTHRQLFAAVWGNGSGDAQQYLRVHVAALRRKLEPDPVRPRLIVTEPGIGYRLDAVP